MCVFWSNFEELGKSLLVVRGARFEKHQDTEEPVTKGVLQLAF
jgi:hypothetical protein